MSRKATGRPDWADMTSAHKNGIHAGRYLYRSHAVRHSCLDGRDKFMAAGSGAVSVVDLETVRIGILVQRGDREA